MARELTSAEKFKHRVKWLSTKIKRGEPISLRPKSEDEDDDDCEHPKPQLTDAQVKFVLCITLLPLFISILFWVTVFIITTFV